MTTTSALWIARRYSSGQSYSCMNSSRCRGCSRGRPDRRIRQTPEPRIRLGRLCNQAEELLGREFVGQETLRPDPADEALRHRDHGRLVREAAGAEQTRVQVWHQIGMPRTRASLTFADDGAQDTEAVKGRYAAGRGLSARRRIHRTSGEIRRGFPHEVERRFFIDGSPFAGAPARAAGARGRRRVRPSRAARAQSSMPCF